MELKIFTKANSSKLGTEKQPMVTVGANNYISINHSAAEKLNLVEGRQIGVAQDKENPKDWFLVLDVEEGFVLKRKESSNKQFYIQSSSLNREMRESLGLDLRTRAFLCLKS